MFNWTVVKKTRKKRKRKRKHNTRSSGTSPLCACVYVHVFGCAPACATCPYIACCWIVLFFSVIIKALRVTNTCLLLRRRIKRWKFIEYVGIQSLSFFGPNTESISLQPGRQHTCVENWANWQFHLLLILARNKLLSCITISFRFSGGMKKHNFELLPLSSAPHFIFLSPCLNVCHLSWWESSWPDQFKRFSNLRRKFWIFSFEARIAHKMPAHSHNKASNPLDEYFHFDAMP